MSRSSYLQCAILLWIVWVSQCLLGHCLNHTTATSILESYHSTAVIITDGMLPLHTVLYVELDVLQVHQLSIGVVYTTMSVYYRL